MPNCNIKTNFYKSKLHCFKSLHEWNRELGVLCLGGVLGIHLWPTIPTRGTHNTPSLHHPQTSQSPTTSVTKPHPSPRTVVLPQPPTVVRAERPAPSPSVRPKQPTLPRTAPNSSNTSNKGLPQMADIDHCSEPHDHNDHCSRHHTICQPHTPDHLQILQAGLHSHKGLVCR